jgi:density-regulated protein DRP1
MPAKRRHFHFVYVDVKQCICVLTNALPCYANIQILYCGACSCPPEYCGWTGAKVGTIDEACKTWLLANAPVMAAKFGYDGADGEAAAAGGDGEGKPMPGGKKKKDAVKEVLVSSKQRQKKKYVCTVRGLEGFGVKLPDACKVFKKKFSTGASVTETPDQKEEIEIQVSLFSLPLLRGVQAHVCVVCELIRRWIMPQDVC